MTEHEKSLEARIVTLEKGQQEILDILRPISETYRTASQLGRWLMGTIVFLSLLVGVILAITKITKK